MARKLEIEIVGDASSLNRTLKQSNSRLSGLGRTAGIAGLAVGGALVVGLKKSVDAAMEAETSQARLEQAFKGAKVQIDPYRASIEKASKAALQLGFDDEDLKNSLGSLVIETGDFKKAQDLSNVAMDIARFKNTDLESATKMLTMAMAGSQRAVKQLGIAVSPTTENYDKLKRQFGSNVTASEKVRLEQAKLIDKQMTAAKTIEIVRDKVKGQGQAYSETAAGGMARFNVQMEELQETIGTKLLPALNKILPKLIALTEHTASFVNTLSKIKGPSGLDVVNALAAAWRSTASAIERAARALDGFLGKLGKLKGPSGIDLVRGIGGLFGDASSSISRVHVATGPGSISPKLYDELSSARSMGLALSSGYRPGAVTKHGTRSDHGTYPSKAIDVAGSAGNMARFFTSLIGNSGVKQAFYDPLGSIFAGVRSGYREGGHSDHVHVATYAKGGIFRRPTLGIIGEAGPEAVIPLSKHWRTPQTGYGQPLQVNLVVDARTLASVLVDPMRNEIRQVQRAGGVA